MHGDGRFSQSRSHMAFTIVHIIFIFIISYMHFPSSIHGLHEYQVIWSSALDKELDFSREADYPNNPYAISILKVTWVVGQILVKVREKKT